MKFIICPLTLSGFFSILVPVAGYGRIAQLGEHLPYKQGVTGSSPVVPTTSERTLLRSDFCIHKNRSHAPSFLLFRKKARSAHLFACKRAHDDSPSLPPFREDSACGAEITKLFGFSRLGRHCRLRFFIAQKLVAYFAARLLSHKGAFASAICLQVHL